MSVVIGVAVFDERFRNSPADLVGEALGLALIMVAAVALTRTVTAPSPRASTVEREQGPVRTCSSAPQAS